MSPEALPFIRVGPFLLLSLQGDLEDETVVLTEASLTRELARRASRGVLLEVSGLTVVDSFIARVLARIVSTVKLLGARAVVVGIQPAMAITLVELGLDLRGIPTALNAEQGMRMLQTEERPVDAPRGKPA